MKKLLYIIGGLVMLCLISSVSAWTNDLNDNLVAYWRFNQTSGTNIPDEYDYIANATAYNIESGDWLTGANDNALDLDGSNEYAKVINTSYDLTKFRTDTNDFTISLWVYRNASSSELRIMSQRHWPYTGFEIGKTANEHLTATIEDTDGTAVTATDDGKDIPLGRWAHVAVVFNKSANNMTRYIDGAQTGTIDALTAVTNTTTGASIGFGVRKTDATPDMYWKGGLDEIAFFNRSLSATEIAALNNSFYEDVDVTLSTPANGYGGYPTNNITFVANLEAINGQLTNATLYIDDVVNDTNTYTGVTNATDFSVLFAAGDYNWSVRACTSNNICRTSITRDFSSDVVVVNDEAYTNTTIEGNTEIFRINVTTPVVGKRLTQGNLIYNGTSYAGTITNPAGDNYTVSYNLAIPTVSADTNYTFYWNIILEDGQSYNHTHHNQTVQNLDIDDCSANTYVIINFTHRDETTQALISSNNTIKLDVDIYPIGSSSPIMEYNNTYGNTSSAAFCLADDLSTTSYTMDVQAVYDSNVHAYEHYHIQNLSLINASLGTKINLYDLKDSNSQEFQITYKDETFLPVSNALIQIQRKYVSEGVFKTVEIPITDSSGQTIGHFVESDEIYTITVTKYGKTLATFENVRAVCQNPTLETCEINLNSFGTSLSLDDLTTGDDVTFTLSYNETSKIVSTAFTIPSGTASTMLLNVTLFDNIGKTQVCSDSLTSSAGTLSCTIPATIGNATVIAKVSKDGTVIGTGFIDLSVEPEDLYGANLVFLGLFLFLTLIGVAVTDNPMITGVFIVVGVIILIGINLIDTGTSSFIGAGATFLWLVLAVIIVLIKGARRS